MNGLYCTNFAHSRLNWRPCKQVWCGDCYTPHHLDHFYQHTLTDDDGFDWRPPEELLQHRHARAGDHLLIPFQCDLCWFQNLQYRDPLTNDRQDDLLLFCIWQASLDALWGKESDIIQAMLQVINQMGAFPVSDSFGFSVALAMLMKSL
jgi:hypothetical protein